MRDGRPAPDRGATPAAAVSRRSTWSGGSRASSSGHAPSTPTRRRSIGRGGRVTPRSHWLTADCATPTRTPTCPWVSPAAQRATRMLAAIPPGCPERGRCARTAGSVWSGGRSASSSGQGPSTLISSRYSGRVGIAWPRSHLTTVLCAMPTPQARSVWLSLAAWRAARITPANRSALPGVVAVVGVVMWAGCSLSGWAGEGRGLSVGRAGGGGVGWVARMVASRSRWWVRGMKLPCSQASSATDGRPTWIASSAVPRPVCSRTTDTAAAMPS